MDKKKLMIAGAVLVVVIIIGMIVQSSGPATKKTAAVKEEGTQVLVANKLLLTGDKLKAEDVRWQPFSDDAVYKGLIKKKDQKDPDKLSVYDAPLRRNIESGEPITTQSLITDTKGTFLSALVAPNMRAASVNVSLNTGVSGFIAPGDHVDVILTYVPKMSGPGQEFMPKFAQRYASQRILSNVKVLGVDQDSKDEKHDTKVAKTVTLEVTLEDASRLALAEQMGTLSLFLRRIGEQDDPNMPPPPLVTDMTTSDILQKASKMAEESKNTQQFDTVRIYSADTVKNIPVRQLPEQQ
jgi:pilus assembly protein CpaB